MGLRMAGFVLAGAGLFLFVAGAALALLFGSERACVDAGLGTALCQARASRMLLAAAVLWSAAVVAVLVGGVLVLMDWRSHRPTRTVQAVQGMPASGAPRPGPGPAMPHNDRDRARPRAPAAPPQGQDRGDTVRQRQGDRSTPPAPRRPEPPPGAARPPPGGGPPQRPPGAVPGGLRKRERKGR